MAAMHILGNMPLQLCRMVTQWLVLFPHSRRVRGGFDSNIWPGSFCVKFICSPCVCVGSLVPPKVMQLVDLD